MSDGRVGPLEPRTYRELVRLALSFLQHLSGIATLTRRFVDASAGRIAILDTRKTTPTLRAIEKYAVLAGGGRNHRMGLDAAILVKANHARLAGGIEAAVGMCRGRARTEISGGVTLDRLPALAETGADFVSVGALTHSAPAADLSVELAVEG